jgi:alpha-tubulin suppressor-like RCC1 family protein
MMTPRKINQIAAGGEDSLYALCNDGSVWVYTWGEDDEPGRWVVLEPIAEDKVVPGKPPR